MSDPMFLRDVQRAGWIVEAADKSGCVARCPAAGCETRVRIDMAGHMPQRGQAAGSVMDVPVGSFHDAREFLRERRRLLSLRIEDVEHAAGMADWHLAKFERDATEKIPNVQTFIEWAGALGFAVVLRPQELPLLTLRLIAESRDAVDARQRRFELERSKRHGRLPSGEGSG